MKFSDFLHDQAIFQNGYEALQPAASIVMPTYARNKEGLLTSCIESVLAQTFQNFEFIIVDDGSSDGSQDVITGYARKDPRIVYVRHDQNSGLPALRTDEAILLARAPYVGFIFDDNIWFPDTLKVMLDTFQTSQAEMVHGFVGMERTKDKITFGIMPLSRELLPLINTIPNGAVMCSRTFFDRVGLYDPHLILRRTCDWDLWLRAARLGIKFQCIEQVLGEERGVLSPVSLGNTVKLDYKVAFSYMDDPDRNGERTESLRPHRILDYQVFDAEKLMPHIRDLAEWEEVRASIYDPFFKTHPDFDDESLLRNNRRFDLGLNHYRLNPITPIFKRRQRILILTNRLTRIVQDWIDALRHDPNNIVLTSGEWSWGFFSPYAIDQLILMDCEMAAIMPFLQDCQSLGIPILYAVVHGLDKQYRERLDPLGGLDLTRYKVIREVFNATVYFGLPGVPWPDAHRQDARFLMDASDQVVIIGAPEQAALMEGVNPCRFQLVPNRPVEKGLSNTQFDLALYLADPGQLEEKSLDAARQLLGSAQPSLAWTIYILPGEAQPAWLNEFSGKARVIQSVETLPSLVRSAGPAIWIVPHEIIGRFSGYYQLLMEEDLAFHGGLIVDLDDLPPQMLLSSEALMEGACKLKECVLSRSNSYRTDARFLQIQNIAQGVALRKKIASLKKTARAHSVKTMVLINSQALSGSEIYGLQVAKVLANIGFDVQAATEASFDRFPAGVKNINNWLESRDLRPILQAEYGKVSRSINLPVLPERDLQAYSDHLRDWLDFHGVDLVFSSGYISEPVVGWSEKRLTFMVLFQPSEYNHKRMAYLRYRVDGLVSDSNWSASFYGRWMPPPVKCVPSMVEHDCFSVQNTLIPPEPVCIAMSGTVQPRKRQREAVLAIRSLVKEGYDVRLNIYGYQLDFLSGYIEEIKKLVEDPVLSGRVIFHGFLKDTSVISRDNHIILSTSTDESLPQGLIFNQASGLIAVSCPAGGIEEFVQDGVTGFLSKSFSTEDCAEALRRAIDCRDQWPQISERARLLVKEECSEQIFTHRLLEMMSHGADIRLSEGRRYFYHSASRDHQAFAAGRSAPGGAPPRKRPAEDSINIASLAIGPEIDRGQISYSLTCDRDLFSGIHFRIGTYYTHPKGIMKVAVISPSGSYPLREARLDLSTLYDNQWVRVDFEPIQNSSGQRYIIQISGEVQDGRLALYESLPTTFRKVHETILLGQRGLRRFVRFPLKRPHPAFYPVYNSR